MQKINKDNAWSLTIIDNMNNLCRSHHTALKNFQIVGSSLEASTKIYSLRVDSVHSDILRMTSGLGRMRSMFKMYFIIDYVYCQFYLFLCRIADQPTNDNNDNDDLNNSNGDGDTSQGDCLPKPPPVKKKRAKKAVITVTKNKETLNARLEISQMPDSLRFKQNSTLDETNSITLGENKLFLSTLETKVSNLKLTLNDPFWDKIETEPFDTMADENEKPFTALPLTINSNPRHSIRQQLSGQKFLEKPILDEDE